ncbi:MAG: Undecaprenyl-phosphate galactosephosphotransferase [Armatimonadetes bacterium]|jgi:exopolysaccharide biosynthesis polyprenyl glycosylphosphotransferase|nr:Undecaprenyl-phosphate galactosephosphotransferase [Armatimonadota bacterium]
MIAQEKIVQLQEPAVVHGRTNTTDRSNVPAVEVWLPEGVENQGERLSDLGHIPTVHVPHAVAKRTVDILVSLIALTLGFPIFLLVALLVKVTSQGPVLFKQTRVGVGGRLFTCYKYRSMYLDAEARLEEVRHLNELSGPVFKIKNDPRITPVGRFIRKASLDELPQFLNVLRGEMSLVGPRPPIPEEVRKYGARERGRLAVRPGLTCLWQIGGRSSVDFEHWVELDLAYIRTMSFWGDLVILLKTIPAVLTARGAC